MCVRDAKNKSVGKKGRRFFSLAYTWSLAISSNLKLQEKICLAFGKTAESRPPRQVRTLSQLLQKVQI